MTQPHQNPVVAGPRRYQKILLAAFGVLVSLLVLELGLRLGGLVFQRAQDRRNDASLAHEETVRILCLGESTTALGGDDAYPRQLERILNEMPDGPRVSVVNGGLTGTKSAVIVDQMPSWIERYRPDVVIAMMGVNDVGEQVRKRSAWLEKLVAWGEDLRVYKLYALLLDHLEKRLTPDAAPDAQARARSRPSPAPTEVPKANPHDPTISAARRAARRGQINQAYAMIEGVLASDATSLQALTALKDLNATNPHPRVEASLVRAEQKLQARHRRAPEDAASVQQLVQFYLLRGRVDLAGDALLSAPAAPISSRERVVITRALWRQAIRLENEGKVAEARAALQKAVVLVAPSEVRERTRFLAQLARLERRSGNDAEGARLSRQAEELRAAGYVEVTRASYRRLKQILDAKGVRLVAMQYPLRPIEPLREMLDDAPDVVFLSNQKAFEEALQKQPYETFFWDSFAGDFGHATPAGNEVLARNAARVLRETVLRARE